MARGSFIVLEGIDGAGTTTQAQMLERALRERGISSVVTREPSDGPIGLVIRNILRGRVRLPDAAGGGQVNQESIALLFAADRLDHVESEVAPALEQGVWVISDRYVHSSVAYQGVLVERGWVEEINRYAVQADLTMFMDVDVDRALERIGSTRVQRDMYETRATLTRIAQSYRAIFAEADENTVTLDANRPIPEVHRDVLMQVSRFLGGDDHE